MGNCSAGEGPQQRGAGPQAGRQHQQQQQQAARGNNGDTAQPQRQQQQRNETAEAQSPERRPRRTRRNSGAGEAGPRDAPPTPPAAAAPASPTPARQQAAHGVRWICVASRAGAAVKLSPSDSAMTIAGSVSVGSALAGTGASQGHWREVYIDGGKGWIKTQAMGVVYFRQHTDDMEGMVEGPVEAIPAPNLSQTISDISEAEDIVPMEPPTAPAMDSMRRDGGPGSPQGGSGSGGGGGGGEDPASPQANLIPQHPFGRDTMHHLRRSNAEPNAPPAPPEEVSRGSM